MAATQDGADIDQLAGKWRSRPLADLQPLSGMLHRGPPKLPFAANARSDVRQSAGMRTNHMSRTR